MTPAQVKAVKAAIIAAIVALSAFAIVAVPAAGAWRIRGMIADKQIATLKAKIEADHKKALQDALDNAEASQRAAAESEARRLAEQGKERIVYRDIEKEVVRYVETHSSPDGCGLTDDGLRLWRAARDAQPVDSGKPAK